MKKYIIAFYSRSGASKKAAERLLELLGEQADIEEIIDVKDRKGIFGAIGAAKDASKNNITNIRAISNPPANYEEVIIVTPIWAGKMADAVRTYLAAYKSDVKTLTLVTVARYTTGESVQKDILMRFSLRIKELISLKRSDILDGNTDEHFENVIKGE